MSALPTLPLEYSERMWSCALSHRYMDEAELRHEVDVSKIVFHCATVKQTVGGSSADVVGVMGLQQRVPSPDSPVVLPDDVPVTLIRHAYVGLRSCEMCASSGITPPHARVYCECLVHWHSEC